MNAYINEINYTGRGSRCRRPTKVVFSKNKSKSIVSSTSHNRNITKVVYIPVNFINHNIPKKKIYQPTINLKPKTKITYKSYPSPIPIRVPVPIKQVPKQMQQVPIQQKNKIAVPTTRVTGRIAVLIHLANHHLWREISNYLKNVLPHQPDIYINLVSNLHIDSEIERIKGMILSQYPNALILLSSNVGMDIGGTMFLLDYILKQPNIPKYDFFLKIHSKSDQKWRRELLGNIASNRIMVNKVLANFQSHPRVGLIGSQQHLRHIGYKFDTYNQKVIESYCTRYGMNNSFYNKHSHFGRNRGERKNASFIAGTIFWIRGNILYNFFQGKDIPGIIGELEAGLVKDMHNRVHTPTRTHSWERLWGIITSHYNFQVIGV